MPVLSRITLLDNRLANQIAAGEVVERPSSVVKELLENSVDSGATRIEVEIERGGTRLIRVTDNGKGIHHDDLQLALTRHATSKIQTTEDLSNIQSLGFRGEALASISAVSRLSLTSRTHQSDLAWRAIAQGRDMTVEVTPAAAIAGTRIEVCDLFFNTPARQKFLRAEKTEFNHIEEVFKRQALANFEIAFVLKHNHKIVKRVTACGEPQQQLERVAAICGKAFAENVIAFNCEHEQMQIYGWLGHPQFHRSESDIQYVFINHRPVRDKTLNHAIRQAYEGLLPPGRMAAYVIFLNIDPHQVDVNVHPTKHEVRFGQQRLVHDLLVKSVGDAIAQQLLDTPLNLPSLNVSHSYSPETNSSERNSPETSTAATDSPETDSSEISSAQHTSPPTVQNSLQPRNQFHQPKQLSAYSNEAVTNYVHNSLGINSKPIINESIKQYTDEIVAEWPSLSQAEKQDTFNRTLTSNDFLREIGNGYWLAELFSGLYVIDGKALIKNYIDALLSGVKTSEHKALLFPQALKLEEFILEDYQTHLTLNKLGFVFEISSPLEMSVQKIPLWLSTVDSPQLFSMLANWLTQTSSPEQLSLSILISQNSLLQQLSTVGLIAQQLLASELSSNAITTLSAANAKAMFK